MGDSDEEDWDAEFGFDDSGEVSSDAGDTKKQMQALLGGGSDAPTNANGVGERRKRERGANSRIVGIMADRLDPKNKENDWDDDFAWDSDKEEAVTGGGLGILLKRTKASLEERKPAQDSTRMRSKSKSENNMKRGQQSGRFTLSRRRTLAKVSSEIQVSPRLGSSSEMKDHPSPCLQLPLQEQSNEADVEDEKDVESDEDWDVEMGFEPAESQGPLSLAFLTDDVGDALSEKPAPQKFSLRLGDISNDSQREPVLSPRLHLFQENVASIHKFAKPTLLFSMKENEGHRLYNNEQDMLEWLDQIVHRHVDSIEAELSGVPTQVAARKRAEKKLSALTKFSDAWCTKTLLLLSFQYREGLRDQCWKTVENYFEEGKKQNLKPADEKRLVSPTEHVFYYACKLWTPKRDKQFGEMVTACKVICPGYADLFELMKIETYAHHSEENEDHILPLCQFLTFYNKVSKTADRDHISMMLKAQVIADTQLYCDGMSPLTIARLDRDSDFIEDLDSIKYDPYRDNMSRRPGLYGTEERCSELEKAHTSLPVCFLKAKTAYALSTPIRESKKWQVWWLKGRWRSTFWLTSLLQKAEQLLFEALYVLDTAETLTPSLPPILSQLGTDCLRSYGDVLLENLKYSYAIQSYDACLSSLKLRSRKKEYDALRRKMAKVAQDNNDIKRAIAYYKDILLTCIIEEKINEVLYVSDILSKIYSEMGRLSVAEEYLLGAYSMLMSSKKAQPSLAIETKLKLAQLYLSSFHFERGIQLLKALMEQPNLPPKTKKLVIALLAKAYSKKRWYFDCEQLLTQLDSVSSSSATPTTKERKASNVSQSRIATQGLSRLLSGEHSSQYYELISLNFKHAQKYPEAVCAIDNALNLCSTSSLSTMGKLLYARGKILQEYARNQSVHRFPFEIESLSKRKGRKKGKVSVTKLNSIGDLIQECKSTFDRAYKFFLAVGDEVMAARTVFHIAETYLDYLFPSVALLRLPYSSVCNFPLFSVSDVANAHTDQEKAGIFFEEDEEEDLAQNAKRMKGHARSKSRNMKRKKKGKGETSDSDPQQCGGESCGDNSNARFHISVDDIESPAVLALEINREVSDPMPMLRCYLNMAELRYLQGEIAVAASFWKECVRHLNDLFLKPIVGKFASPSFIRKLYNLTKRAVRFMMCLDSDVINSHLGLIDSLNLLEVCLEHAEKRQPSSEKGSNATVDGSDVAATFRIHSQKTPGARLSVVLPAREESPASGKGGKSRKDRGKGKDRDREKSTTAAPAANDKGLVRQSTIKNVRDMFGTSELPFPMAMHLGEMQSNKQHEEDNKSMRPTRGFGTQEGFAGGSSSKGVEDIAELVWNCLHCIKAQLRKYTDGKLQMEEVFERNQANLRKLGKIVKASLSRTLSPILETKSFGDVSGEHPDLHNLFYVFSINDFIFCFCPSTGKRSCRQLSHAASSASALSSPGVYPSAHQTQLGDRPADCAAPEKLFLKVTVMNDAEEHAVFMSRPDASLTSIINFICDVAQGLAMEEPPASRERTLAPKAARSLLSSFKTTRHGLDIPVQMVESSKGFSLAVKRVIAMADRFHSSPSNSSRATAAASPLERRRDERPISPRSERGRSDASDISVNSASSDDSLSSRGTASSFRSHPTVHRPKRGHGNPSISLALLTSRLGKGSNDEKCGDSRFDGSERHFLPLSGSLEQSLHQCFSTRSALAGTDGSGRTATEPIPLFLYATTACPPIVEVMSAKKKMRGDKRVLVTDEMVSYLSSLLETSSKELPWDDVAYSRKILDDMASMVFPWVLETMPMGNEICDDSPLTLVASRSVQLIPWELLLQCRAVRYLTLSHAVARCSERAASEAIAEAISPRTGRAVSPRTVSDVSSTIQSMVASPSQYPGQGLKFMTVSYPKEDKSIVSEEDRRRRQLKKLALFNLNFWTGPAPTLAKGLAVPFQTPLLRHGKKQPSHRKFRNLRFIDLSEWTDSPSDVLKVRAGRV